MTTETILTKSFLPSEFEDLFDKIHRAFVSLSEMASFQGTLYHKYTKCGKKGCRCYRTKGHGPYFYLKTKTTRKEIYIGKHLPKYFQAKRDAYAELERLVQLYDKIIMMDSDLTNLIRDFVLRSDSILLIHQENQNDRLLQRNL